MKANSAKVHCLWAESDPLLRDYHDKEWGVPQYDSRALWELLMLATLHSSIATDLPDTPPGQRSAYVRYDCCCNAVTWKHSRPSLYREALDDEEFRDELAHHCDPRG